MTDLPAPVDTAAGPNTAPAPWARWPKETAVAYAAFIAYRDTPAPERKYAEIARTFGKHPQTIERWGRTFSWIARSLAWDEELDRRNRHARLNEVEAAARRQASLGLRLQSIAKRGSDSLIERPDRIARMKPSDIVAMAAVGVKIERAALGVPDEYGAHDIRALVAGVAAPGATGVRTADAEVVDVESALADPAVAEAADLLAERLEGFARRARRPPDERAPATLEASPAPELPEP